MVDAGADVVVVAGADVVAAAVVVCVEDGCVPVPCCISRYAPPATIRITTTAPMIRVLFIYTTSW